MGVAVVGPQGEESEAVPGRLQVERTSDGGVRIAAPPRAAAAQVSLFSGMARLIGATNISGVDGGIAEMQ